MSGSIDVESIPGHGATFRFALPLKAADVQETKFAAPRLAGISVLLVAPASIAASLLARRLSRWGANVLLAPESTAAQDVSRQKWDAVIVDHALGVAVATKFAAAVGDNIARRIVLITPSERPHLAALKEAGFTGYLVKPVRAASLKTQLVGSDTFEAILAAPDASNTQSNTDHGEAPRRVKVLIAEDNEINSLLARSLLTKLGHWPITAANGQAALDAWKAARNAGAPFDLVLMDIRMPGLDGLEAARRIRAAEGDARGRTPIIALTANAFAEDREACLKAGMDGFLVKPLDREQLVGALNALPGAGQLAA
jgi:CheY-like chemotaxis protein